MRTLFQIILCGAILAGGLAIWVNYVPAARPLLERAGVFDLLGIESTEAAVAEGNNRRRGGAASVIVAPVQERALADRVSALGDGRAHRSVTVRSNAVGMIKELAIQSGGYVEEGTVIVQLEDESEQIALEQARIALEDANADSDLVRQLGTSGAVTEVRLRETALALRSAELSVRQAEFDLSQRRVVAPISGWVGIIDLERGDRVGAQDVLVEITDRSEILIDFRVPESVIGQIALGDSFAVSPIGAGAALEGEIAAIDTVVDRASRTLLVQGRVANDADMLRAGMAFSVELTFPGETVLSVAPLAIQWSGDGPFVWRVTDGVTSQAPIVIAQRNSDEVLVTSDTLVADDLVVIEGVQSLRSGGEVQIANTPDQDVEPTPAGATGDAL